jgi:uncharacterized delta-60 repeat protein
VRILDNERPEFVDQSFQSPLGDVAVVGMLRQRDGRILLVTEWIDEDGVGEQGLVRLHADGTLDENLRLDPRIRGVFFYSRPPLLEQPNGKILLTAEVLSGSTYYEGLARIGSDGTLDSSFRPGTGGDEIYAFALQPDGKILIGGPALAGLGIPSEQTLARLNADGTCDTDFVPPPAFRPSFFVNDNQTNVLAPASVYAIATGSDGTILVGCSGAVVAPLFWSSFVRLAADGSLDPKHQVSVYRRDVSYVDSIAIDSENDVLVAGEIQTPGWGIVRLKPGGSVDQSFTSSLDPDWFQQLTPRPDGKIFGVSSSTGAFRLNHDGSKDKSFVAGTAVSESLLWPEAKAQVYCALEQPGGRMLIGGDFTTVNGIRRPGLAQIVTEANCIIGIEGRDKSFKLSVTAEPVSACILDSSIDLGRWLPIRTNLAEAFIIGFEDSPPASSARSFYRARSP